MNKFALAYLCLFSVGFAQWQQMPKLNNGTILEHGDQSGCGCGKGKGKGNGEGK